VAVARRADAPARVDAEAPARPAADMPARPAAEQPRLVVLRALGLGDLLTAVPALRALAAHYPAHRRVLAAPAALAALAAAHGLADEVVDVDLRAGGRPAPILPLPPALRGADIAVNLHGRGPESSRMLLGTGPGRLVAFAHPTLPETSAGPRWRDDEHEVDRWCRLLTSVGVPADPGQLDLDVRPDPAASGATVLHPGAASAARRWPAERWAALARCERERGRRVLVTGSAAEVPLARRVMAGAGLEPAALLAGRTDVAGLAAVVAGCARVVCADTGLAHLATATRTPSVVLFGPTSPARWGPPAERPWHRVLWRGRTGDPHAPEPDVGLLAIRVDDVVAALAALPDRADLPDRPARSDGDDLAGTGDRRPRPGRPAAAALPR
jgi:ADP-heptose:LPS heptosyltransferase